MKRSVCVLPLPGLHPAREPYLRMHPGRLPAYAGCTERGGEAVTVRATLPTSARWGHLTRKDHASIWYAAARARAARGDEEGARVAREVARRFRARSVHLAPAGEAVLVHRARWEAAQRLREEEEEPLN